MSLTKTLKAEARLTYQETLNGIPEKVKTKDTVKLISKQWTNSQYQRQAKYDNSFPIYVKLYMGPKDDLCEECMLFLEDIEEQFDIEFKSSTLTMHDSLTAYEARHIRIVFIKHKLTKCHIIEEKVVTTYNDIKRTVIC